MDCNVSPYKSGTPRKSITPGRPAIPITTPTAPSLQGRPCESMITMPMRVPVFSPSTVTSDCAEASGSVGSRATSSLVPLAEKSRFEVSIPAFAQTKPNRCSTMINPGRFRRTRLLSFKMSSTRRGSLLISSAIFLASSDGSTSTRFKESRVFA